MATNKNTESIEAKSDRLASMLDNGQGKQVVNQLRHEFESMSPREYSRFVREISRKDDKAAGANLLVVMQGKAELVLVDDGRGRPNKAAKVADSHSHTAAIPAAIPSLDRSQAGAPRSLADMRQKAIDKDPCARYEDLRWKQLEDISRQYAPRTAQGHREKPANGSVLIDILAQQRLQQLSVECKLSQKKAY